MGEWMYSSTFLDLGTSWTWVVSFTPRQLYPGERAPGTHWIGGWVGPRTSLDDAEKRKFMTLSGLELRVLGRLARSQSLYRLLQQQRIWTAKITFLRKETAYSLHQRPDRNAGSEREMNVSDWNNTASRVRDDWLRHLERMVHHFIVLPK
jgi:hypothetical protein